MLLRVSIFSHTLPSFSAGVESVFGITPMIDCRADDFAATLCSAWNTAHRMPSTVFAVLRIQCFG